MNHYHGKTILVMLLAFMTLSACNTSTVFQESQSPGTEKWDYRQPIVFETEINDTLALHELYLVVRNNTDYAYSNFFLFLDIRFPDHTILRDTIECFLADKSGKWTGKGFGRIKTNQFLFRDNVWFPQSGNYTFSFRHGMREEAISGITDIGIRIDRKYSAQ
jgi:gliding motility-associated lipoprotein GldH